MSPRSINQTPTPLPILERLNLLESNQSCIIFLPRIPAGPLHIPAKRPGFETDPSVIRHPWGYEAGFEPHYQSHSQYYLERDRKPVYYGYPDTQFPQVSRRRGD